MLEVKNVFKKYGKKQVLKGVNLTVKDGEIKGLIGVNGAGKSTLIEIVCGVKKMDSGSISIGKLDIKDKRFRSKIQRDIGYMPQTFSLFNDLTVEENLGYLSAVYGLEQDCVSKTIEMCGLSENKKVIAKNLSGGYRQLLSLAGAIIHSPKFLILDEPTSSMDPIFRRKFWEIINSLKRNKKTILVITHYMEELVECDSFSCLSNGKLSFDGSLNEFKQEKFLNIEEILNKYKFEEENE